MPLEFQLNSLMKIFSKILFGFPNYLLVWANVDVYSNVTFYFIYRRNVVVFGGI